MVHATFFNFAFEFCFRFSQFYSFHHHRRRRHKEMKGHLPPVCADESRPACADGSTPTKARGEAPTRAEGASARTAELPKDPRHAPEDEAETNLLTPLLYLEMCIRQPPFGQWIMKPVNIYKFARSLRGSLSPPLPRSLSCLYS